MGFDFDVETIVLAGFLEHKWLKIPVNTRANSLKIGFLHLESTPNRMPTSSFPRRRGKVRMGAMPIATNPPSRPSPVSTGEGENPLHPLLPFVSNPSNDHVTPIHHAPVMRIATFKTERTVG
jgi:hypothetical protein